MFDIDSWLAEICFKLKDNFANRLLFAGYQGSYRRNEATPASDIDMVVILDTLKAEDLKKYKEIVQTMEYSEKVCGFIGGIQELKNWNRGELFQLYYDTQPLLGDMKDFISVPDRKDAKEAVKNGAQALYHSACHSFLFSKKVKEDLKGLYKQVCFVLQAKYFYETGEYVLRKKELEKCLSGKDKEIINMALNTDKIFDYTEKELENKYRLLIDFCSEQINGL